MRTALAAVTFAALLLGAGGASAQLYAPESLARYFRIEWQAARAVRGPVVEGYVYNQGALQVERMQLVIERLDGSGKVAGSSTVWVLGGVPLGGRAWFRASVAEAAGYRVQVLAFDWVGRGGM